MGHVLRLLNGFSFKEKSILVSMLALAGVYGSYFLSVLGGEVEPSLAGMLIRMIAIVVALVVIHIAYHVVIALDDVSEEEDERDRAVGRRAAVFGYNVLVTTVLIVIGRMLILGAWAEGGSGAGPDLFEITNLLLAGVVLGEIVYYGAQLYFYRRGWQG
jgi:succinate dehydrogenase hydrophobic anchor subunit